MLLVQCTAHRLVVANVGQCRDAGDQVLSARRDDVDVGGVWAESAALSSAP